MKRLNWCFLVFSIFLLSVACDNKDDNAHLKDVQVTIEYPKQDAEVGFRDIVKGKVSKPDVNIYLLLHPLATNIFWVQKLPSAINEDGSWSTICYFGTETLGLAEHFELVAIVTDYKLLAGQKLRTLPQRGIKSNIVTVRRTK